METRAAIVLTTMVLFSLTIFAGCNNPEDPLPEVVACQINLTVPVTSLGPWSSGDMINIRWKKAGPGDFVRIDLKKADAVVAVIKESTANDGFHGWIVSTMGADNGDDFTIMLTVLGQDSCSVETEPLRLINTIGCNYDFTTAAIESPNTILTRDTELEITWDSGNTSGDVRLELTDVFGTIGVISYNTPDDGHFTWQVHSFHNGTYDYYMLKISDLSVPDCGDESGFFGIWDEDICNVWITYPYEHQELTEGTDFEVVFHMDEMTGNADLVLYAGLEYVGHIAYDVDPQPNSYLWRVDDFDYDGTNQKFRLRVVSRDDPYCWDHSDEFTILQP